MLGLVSSTDSRWLDVALGDLDAVLIDHLHCELKAASNSTALVARYPAHPRLVYELTELAREELTHVQQVFAELTRRGITPRPPDGDPYAQALRRAMNDGPRGKTAETGEAAALLDRLTVAALIEARSCERFQLLAKHAPTPALRDWYAELFASEARHHRVFASLAEEIAGIDRARARFDVLSQREAEIVAQGPVHPRVH